MASPYDKLVELIKQLDINDDGIAMNHKIKSIEQDFHGIVLNEQILNELMEYMNDAVLSDSEDTAQKFALLISSRNFDHFSIDKTRIRYKMISLLQKNFLNADEFRKHNNRNMLYNSITLLGEYYNRIRQSDGNLMSSLGSALLEMLTHEINDENCDASKKIDVRLAKLILSQITLNGKLLQTGHKDELNTLLYHIRRVLIESRDLKKCVKALLLMTLDLFYSNFCSLGTKLEEMYTKHLIDAENYDDDDENDGDIITTTTTTTTEQEMNKLKIDEENQQQEEFAANNCSPVENKKWSEQVYEENLDEEQSPINGYCDTSPSSNTSIYNNRFNNSSLDLCNDDRQSVRSEGGSLKLYNVKDRLRSLQRNYHHHNQSLGKLNKQQQTPLTWNYRYHSYDRNRGNSRNNLSSANNYNNNENNSHFNGNHNPRNLYNNHRLQYDRPPRFSKYQQQQYHQQQQQNHHQQQQNSNQEYNSSWRNQEGSEADGQNINNFNDKQNSRDTSADGSAGGESRELETRMPPSRNITQSNRNYVRYPRNQRENSFERNNYNPAAVDSNRNFNRGSNGNLRRNNNYSPGVGGESGNWNQNRRQSADRGNMGTTGGGGGYRSRNWNNARYGSQNSLASDTTGGTFERRNRRGFSSKNNQYQNNYRNNDDRRSSVNAIE